MLSTNASRHCFWATSNRRSDGSLAGATSAPVYDLGACAILPLVQIAAGPVRAPRRDTGVIKATLRRFRHPGTSAHDRLRRNIAGLIQPPERATCARVRAFQTH